MRFDKLKTIFLMFVVTGSFALEAKASEPNLEGNDSCPNIEKNLDTIQDYCIKKFPLKTNPPTVTSAGQTIASLQASCIETRSERIKDARDRLSCSSEDLVAECKELKKDYKETLAICKAITKNSDSSEGHASIFSECAEIADSCRAESADEESEDNSCAWMTLQTKSIDQKKALEDQVDVRESDMIKQIAQAEIDSKEMQIKRQKDQQKLEADILDIRLQLASIPAEIGIVEQASAYKKLDLDEGYSRDLLNLSSQLKTAEGLDIFSVQNAYEDAVNTAKNNCRDLATARYNELRAQLQAQMTTLNGVSRTFQKLSKAEIISDKMAKCITDDVRYAQSLNKAAKDRATNLEAKNNQIANLKDQINQLILATSRRSQLLINSTNGDIRKLGENQQTLAVKLQKLQAELQSIGSPDQSEMMASMQQQRQNMSELNRLNKLKAEVGVIKKTPLNSENFWLIGDLEEGDGDNHPYVDEYKKACNPSRKSDTAATPPKTEKGGQ